MKLRLFRAGRQYVLLQFIVKKILNAEV